MNNHDQTKLEIVAAATEVSEHFGSSGTDIHNAIHEAFVLLAAKIHERVEARFQIPEEGR